MDNLRRVLYTQEEAALNGIELDSSNLYTGVIKGVYLPTNYGISSHYPNQNGGGILEFAFCDSNGNNATSHSNYITSISINNSSYNSVPYTDTLHADTYIINYMYATNQAAFATRWTFRLWDSYSDDYHGNWINISVDPPKCTLTQYPVPIDNILGYTTYIYVPLPVVTTVKTCNNNTLTKVKLTYYRKVGQLPIYYVPDNA